MTPDVAMRKCKACERQYPETEKQCPDCSFPATHYEPCVVCGSPIPNGKRCKACSTYRIGRFNISFSQTFFAMLVAMISVIASGHTAISYVHDRDSNTRFKVTGADPDHIYLKVWNTGRNPSTLVGYRIIFDEQPGKEVMLELRNKDKQDASNVIVSGSPVTIGLSIPVADRIPQSLRARQYTDAERDSLLRHKAPGDQVLVPLTLEIDVEESDDPSWFGIRSVHKRRDSFSSGRIAEFLPAI